MSHAPVPRTQAFPSPAQSRSPDDGDEKPAASAPTGMIQQLRNAVVAPTGMGKNYGRIMPLLRQG